MDTEKKRRLAKFKRKRKEIRIANYTQHWLNALSSYYQSTETAIIEAAVQAFAEHYKTEAMEEIRNKQGGQNWKHIETAKNYEKIAKNIDEGILHV